MAEEEEKQAKLNDPKYLEKKKEEARLRYTQDTFGENNKRAARLRVVCTAVLLYTTLGVSDRGAADD